MHEQESDNDTKLRYGHYYPLVYTTLLDTACTVAINRYIIICIPILEYCKVLFSVNVFLFGIWYYLQVTTIYPT